MDTGGFEIRTPGEDRPVALAMQRLWVTGQILPVGARVLVQHTFRNGEDKPLEVIYAFMLPRDAALRRFEVRGDGFEAHSELRKVEQAVAEYEAGIDAGHLSTLARSYRDGVVNLSIGNLKKGDDVTVTLEILAGVEMHDDGLRFRFPFTLAPGYHAQARMVDNDGSGEIELPRSEFGDVILPTYKRAADGLHEVGFDLSLRIPGKIAEVGSPSHGIRYRDEEGGRRVSLAPASDVPNRDLVLEVKLAKAEAAPLILAGDKHFGVAIPSTRFGQLSNSPRKVAMVIDRSGSMQGQPMAQARKAVEACLGALGPDDEFALVAFDDSVDAFRSTLTKATSEGRAEARKFMLTVDARGGTELARGFADGARMVAGGGDVLVITDGQVMGTEDIISKARSLGVRIHCLGIGSASQDRFLAQLASSTEGVSRMVTVQERVDVAAVDLFASIGRPVASGITVKGARLGIEPPSAVFAGTPWVAFGEVDSHRKLTVNWTGGSMDVMIPASETEVAETVGLLSGAKQITDIESRLTSLPAVTSTALADREQSRLERRLEQLSTEFGLASRSMALVAVVKREADRAGELPTTQVVPLGMPQDTQYDAYFSAPVAGGAPAPMMMPSMAMSAAPPMPAQMAANAAKLKRNVQRGLISPKEAIDRLFNRNPGQRLVGLANVRQRKINADEASVEILAEMPMAEPDITDRLIEIASTLDPDGGLTGGNGDDRALKTASAVLLFLSEGHTPTDGAFRAHVERMVRFLETVTGLSAEHRAIVDRVVAFVRSGKKPKQANVDSWQDIDAAID